MTQTLLFTVDANADTNMVLPDRRLGLLKFTDQLLHDEQLEGELRLVFSWVIPIDCKHDFSAQLTRILCISPAFDPVGLGDVIPEYTAVIIRPSIGAPGASQVSFVKQGNPLPSGAQPWPFPTGGNSPQITGGTSPSQPTSTGPDVNIDFDVSVPLDDAGCVKDANDVKPTSRPFDSIKDMFK